MAKRQIREGEYTCSCCAYRFPHRMFSGKCDGSQFVDAYWNMHYGTGECQRCNNLNTSGEIVSCDVVQGGTSTRHCEALESFVVTNAIKRN